MSSSAPQLLQHALLQRSRRKALFAIGAVSIAIVEPALPARDF